MPSLNATISNEPPCLNVTALHSVLLVAVLLLDAGYDGSDENWERAFCKVLQGAQVLHRIMKPDSLRRKDRSDLAPKAGGEGKGRGGDPLAFAGIPPKTSFYVYLWQSLEGYQKNNVQSEKTIRQSKTIDLQKLNM